MSWAFREKEKEKKNNVILLGTEKRRIRRPRHPVEEERQGREKSYRKSKLLIPYFLVGVGINFILSLSGLNFSNSPLLYCIVSPGIPAASMFILSELHYRIFFENDPVPPGSRLKSKKISL